MTARPPRRALMVSYAFPPANLSGAHRPFHFVKHLPEFGYFPVVLASRSDFGLGIEHEALAEIEGRCRVVRFEPWSVRRTIRRMLARRPAATGSILTEAPAGSTRKRRPRSRSLLPASLNDWLDRQLLHLRTYGPIVMAGMREHRADACDLIWATGDPWESLVAGYWLERLTGLPLVVDLRDPWAYGFMMSLRPPWQRRWHREWEPRVVARASRTILTSPLTSAEYRRRYPAAADRILTITNGFAHEPAPEPVRHVERDKCLLCFAGRLWRGLRNPAILLEGLKLACGDPEIARDVRLQIVGEMDGHDSALAELGLEEHVSCAGPVTAAESRRFLYGADVLVLLQTIPGGGIDAISGKLYEYLAADRPILCIADPRGGDAWLLGEVGTGEIVGLSGPEAVAAGIRRCWRDWKSGRLGSGLRPEEIARFDRRNLTGELAGVFDELLRPTTARS